MPESASAHPSPTAGVPNPQFARVASEDRLLRTAEALSSNGMRATVVSSSADARAAVLALIPRGSAVLVGSSQTVSTIGLARELQGSSEYRDLHAELVRLMQEGKGGDARRLGAAPEYVVGSVHAVTEDGRVVVASATGSQLGPYSYGAGKVIWVVGAQKVVKDLDEAFRRVTEYSVPLEDARARKVYGQGTVLAKLLVVQREVQPERISVVLVRENLGF